MAMVPQDAARVNPEVVNDDLPVGRVRTGNVSGDRGLRPRDTRLAWASQADVKRSDVRRPRLVIAGSRIPSSDRFRDNLDRNAAYTVAAYLA
jgi:hypothetical protein